MAEDKENRVTDEGGKAKEMKEITLKFGKGCLEDEFTARDGTAYRKILVPNIDPKDTRPWQTFVAKANHVHDNQFGKGAWMKLPAEGHTTLHRSIVIGEKPDGTKEWGTEKTTVSNKELKKMMEAYKEKSKESIKDKIEEKKAVASAINAKTEKTAHHAKTAENAL